MSTKRLVINSVRRNATGTYVVLFEDGTLATVNRQSQVHHIIENEDMRGVPLDVEFRDGVIMRADKVRQN